MPGCSRSTDQCSLAQEQHCRQERVLEKTLTPAHCLQSSAHSRSRRGAGQWLSRETTVYNTNHKRAAGRAVYTPLYTQRAPERQRQRTNREKGERMSAPPGYGAQPPGYGAQQPVVQGQVVGGAPPAYAPAAGPPPRYAAPPQQQQYQQPVYQAQPTPQAQPPPQYQPQPSQYQPPSQTAQAMPQAMPGHQLMAVTCPAGAGAGTAVQIQGPSGALFQVAVPAGVGPGMTFHVQVPTNPPAQVRTRSSLALPSARTTKHSADSLCVCLHIRMPFVDPCSCAADGHCDATTADVSAADDAAAAAAAAGGPRAPPAARVRRLRLRRRRRRHGRGGWPLRRHDARIDDV